MAPRVALAAVLTGGAARRMGVRKADLPYDGAPLVERVWDVVRRFAQEVVCVGGGPFLAHRGVETLPDEFPGADSLGGIATALGHALRVMGPDAWVLVNACDMPHLKPDMLNLLIAQARDGDDIVVPRTALGFEPLCALYRARVRPFAAAQIEAGNLRIRDLFRAVATREVGEELLRKADPELASFRNINRPEDI